MVVINWLQIERFFDQNFFIFVFHLTIPITLEQVALSYETRRPCEKIASGTRGTGGVKKIVDIFAQMRRVNSTNNHTRCTGVFKNKI